MYPSTTHVIVADYNQKKIASLLDLITLAEKSNTMLEWYEEVCKVFGDDGQKLLKLYVSKLPSPIHERDRSQTGEGQVTYRAYGSRCGGRHRRHYSNEVPMPRKDRNAEGKRHRILCRQSPSLFGTQKGTLEVYKKNILGLMQAQTMLIRGNSIVMEVHKGIEAVTKVWQ